MDTEEVCETRGAGGYAIVRQSSLLTHLYKLCSVSKFYGKCLRRRQRVAANEGSLAVVGANGTDFGADKERWEGSAGWCIRDLDLVTKRRMFY